MESIRLIWSETLERAERDARRLGEKLEHNYPNMDGREVKWVFRGLRLFEVLVADGNSLDAPEKKQGTPIELFSRFLDDKCAQLLLADMKKAVGQQFR